MREWACHVNRAHGHDPYVPLDGGQGTREPLVAKGPLHAPPYYNNNRKHLSKDRSMEFGVLIRMFPAPVRWEIV